MRDSYRKGVVIFVFIWCLISLFVVPVWAADITLKWDSSAGATGYKIYRSADNGTTWTMVQQVGAVTEQALTAQPDTGLVLYRIGAFNATGETTRWGAGAWYNKSWEPPAQPTGTGIQ